MGSKRSEGNAPPRAPGLRAILSKELPDTLVAPLAEHHAEIVRAQATGDWEKVLVRGGKLAETAMKLVHFERTGNQPDQVSVDAEIKAAESDGNLRAEFRTLVPRHARVIYDHRSKRGGGHASFVPAEMDAILVTSVANWLIAELVRIYGQHTSDDAHDFVRRLVRFPAPLIETIGSDVLVLAPDVTMRDEVGLLLYRMYPGAASRIALRSWLRQGTDGAFRTLLSRLRQERLVHETKDGVQLTLLGLSWATELANFHARN